MNLGLYCGCVDPRSGIVSVPRLHPVLCEGWLEGREMLCAYIP